LYEFVREDAHVDGFSVKESAGGFCTLSGNPQFHTSDLLSETVGTMIASRRVFTVKGEGEDAARNLILNVRARMAIVARTTTIRFGFPEGEAITVASGKWDKDQPFTPREGTSAYDAYRDPWDHPGDYELGCKHASVAAMYAGITDVLEKSAFDAAFPSTALASSRNGLRDDVWIPGDKSFMANPAAVTPQQQKTIPSRLWGENIIYVGNGHYWGFLGKGGGAKTAADWQSKIAGWHDQPESDVKFADYRQWTNVGLVP
jgi:hypothetical protein